MEIFELRYFLGAARTENLQAAAENLNVSPASLSKAIARLEDELGVKLFRREGRNIQISLEGRLLQKRASEIVRLTDSTRTELAGARGELHVVLAGTELLLGRLGFRVAGELKRKFPGARFEFRATDDETALEWVRRGEVHLAAVTMNFPSGLATRDGLVSRVVEEATFETFVGKAHPLYAEALAEREVPVGTVLEHAFVSPNHPLLGKVGARQSADGWRDDRFPRRIEYLTSSLKLLEELVVGGRAIAYLPDYYGKRLEVLSLRITGCPYFCRQKLRLVARDPQDVGWLAAILDS